MSEKDNNQPTGWKDPWRVACAAAFVIAVMADDGVFGPDVVVIEQEKLEQMKKEGEMLPNETGIKIQIK